MYKSTVFTARNLSKFGIFCFQIKVCPNLRFVMPYFGFNVEFCTNWRFLQLEIWIFWIFRSKFAFFKVELVQICVSLCQILVFNVEFWTNWRFQAQNLSKFWFFWSFSSKLSKFAFLNAKFWFLTSNLVPIDVFKLKICRNLDFFELSGRNWSKVAFFKVKFWF